jgi:hypothetical protein
MRRKGLATKVTYTCERIALAHQFPGAASQGVWWSAGMGNTPGG